MSSPADSGEDKQLRARLRSLRVDPPPGDFEAALHRRLAAAGPPEASGVGARLRHWFRGGRAALWPAAGLALGLGLFLALHVADSEPTTRLPGSKVAVVRVDLSVGVAVANADIQVTLPDGLVFWSEGQELAQRSFQWSQPLSAGNNEIPIAIRGLRPGRYHMKVTARVQGQEIDHDVALEVVSG